MLLLFKKFSVFFNQDVNSRNNDLQLRLSVDELAGFAETAISDFKVMECLRVGNNDFALAGHGIPVLVARLRKRKSFYFRNSS